jgi:hypothetical protein
MQENRFMMQETTQTLLAPHVVPSSAEEPVVFANNVYGGGILHFNLVHGSP